VEVSRTAEAFSSTGVVGSEHDPVHFWRSAFGKAAETIVLQWPHVLMELQSRVSRLDSLFTKLEGLSISSDTMPRPGMERDFKREKVLRIIALQVLDAARIKSELTDVSEESLQRCAHELHRLLAAECLLSQDRLVAEQFLERTHRIPTLAKADQQIRMQLEDISFQSALMPVISAIPEEHRRTS